MDIIIRNEQAYFMNPYYSIITDAQEMERLWKDTQRTSNKEEKIQLLTLAFDLYKGDLCENIDSSTDYRTNGFNWLIGTRLHYRQICNKIANTLMELLAEKSDYVSIWNHVIDSKSAIKAGTADWFCWLIFSQHKLYGEIAAQESYSSAQSQLLSAEVNVMEKHLREVFLRFK